MHPDLAPLFARRSVRRFLDTPVPGALIRAMLEAAMAAPSAVAKDPWDFIVVSGATARNRMADGLPNGQMLRHAPLGILVCGDLNKAHGNTESYMLQDCSAAVENLLVAASMLGLGACWLGVHPRTERLAHMRALFGLLDHVVPVAAIALGYPEEVPPPRTRYNDTLVHHETW
jgi:nitroreductase